MALQMKRVHLWVVMVVASIAILATVVVALVWSATVRAPASPVATKTVPPATQPVSAESKTVFFGNMYFGRYINDWSMASPLQYAYPFSRMSEFNRGSYNAWIAGLECPSVSGLHLTSAEEDATLTFNCDPKYLPEAAKWMTAFTLANNHTGNQGEAGLTETRQHLEASGIQYFGNPDPTVLSDVCEVIALPATVTLDSTKTTQGSLPVALCGYHGVFQIPPQSALDVMKRYAPYMPVIAMPHMGKEYVAYPDELKTTLYREMIDAGADMVLGDHPHWVQTSESYHGHLIVYSMGNFLFDQQDTSEVTRSAGISVDIVAKATSSAELAVWLKIGATCGTPHDNCLATIEAQQLKKLDYTFHMSVIGTDDSHKIVRPADAIIQQAILKRLNWSQTISGLRAPYSAS